MDKKGRKMANLGQKMTFSEKTKMLMMIRAIKYTIYEKIALGDRIPLSMGEGEMSHQGNTSHIALERMDTSCSQIDFHVK